MRILVVAAEESASLHAKELITRLKRLGNYSFFGAGSPALKEIMDVKVPAQQLSFVGLEEPGKILAIARAYLKLRKLLEEADGVLLVDYPGMNLHLAKVAKAKGKKVCYYVAPQIWAWGEWRIRKLKAIDALVCLFPFEEQLFKRHGIEARFFGHPLVERLEKIESHGKNHILLLPGSRNSEVASLIKPMLKAAERLHRELKYPVALVKVPTVRQDLYRIPPWIKVIPFEERYRAMAEAHTAVAASGTATLELALLKVPSVVVYRTSPVSWTIGKRIVKVEYLSIVNILAKREVFPELLQERCTPDNIVRKVIDLLNPAIYRNVVNAVSQIKESLKGEDPYQKAAEFFHETLSKAA